MIVTNRWSHNNIITYVHITPLIFVSLDKAVKQRCNITITVKHIVMKEVSLKRVGGLSPRVHYDPMITSYILYMIYSLWVNSICNMIKY